MPLLLYTYLAAEMVAPFLAGLVILTSVLFLGRLVPLLEGIFGFGIGLADFVRLWAYMTPQLLLFSIPMASMLGIIIAFSRLANENELVALKASGISLYRMLPPVLIVALCTAGLTGLASVELIPRGTVAMKQLLFQLAKEKIDRGLQEKQFSEGINEVVLYVDRIDHENQWHGVYVSDLRDRKTPVTIMAQGGDLQADLGAMFITLTLTEGSLHRSVDDLTQTIHFGTYTLKLPLEAPKTVLGESTAGVDKNSLRQQELLQAAAEAGPGTPQAAGLLVEYHERLALPAACFVLTLLGLPLALPGRPGGRPLGLPAGLFFFMLYFIMLTAAKSLSEGTSLPVGPTMWAPNLLFALLTLLLLRKAAREKNGLLRYRLASLVRKLSAGRGRGGKNR